MGDPALALAHHVSKWCELLSVQFSPLPSGDNCGTPAYRLLNGFYVKNVQLTTWHIVHILLFYYFYFMLNF